MNDDSKVLSTTISKQMPKFPPEVIFISTVDTSKTVILNVNAYQIGINIIIQGALNHFLQMMNQLQIIMHLPMMNTNMPSNNMKFFSAMMPITAFDILS